MGANIVIVDDDKVCTALFTQMLKEEHYTVHSLHKGKQVHEFIVKNDVDIILLDVILPDIDGYEVLQELQRDEITRNIPVIMITGLTSSGEIKKALENGALDFIRKPCEPIELIARVGSALRLKREQDLLNELAQKDALTKLYNRRFFNKTIDAKLPELAKNLSGVSLVLIDIDHFKSVNDTYGHSVGDEVLASIANVLIKSVKSSDIVCRFGGEEFCVILPGASLLKACEVAERIRLNACKVTFVHDDTKFSVTISCGVCNTNVISDKSGSALINAADSALYAAKNNGRNRTEFFGGS